MATSLAGVTTLPGLAVSSVGSRLSNLKSYTQTLDPVSVAANTTAEQTFTVTGLLADDLPLCLVKPTVSAGLGIVNVRVSAANTLAVTFVNATAAPIDAGAESYRLVVVNVEQN